MSTHPKKKKSSTTVRLRLPGGSQAVRAGAHSTGRVRFFPERATMESLTAALQAVQAVCAR